VRPTTPKTLLTDTTKEDTMSLFIEYHLIQNFAPSNLNRDDTGAPKDALFGGHRRARVSSQCFKRAIRLQVASTGAIAADDQSIRTKKLLQLLVQQLKALGRDDEAQVQQRAVQALGAAKLKVDDEGKTEYLLFLGAREITALAGLIHQHWDALAVGPAADDKAKRSKKEAKAELPKEVRDGVTRLLDGGKALDVALFGRMLADLPEANQHPACQVAHAISTHRVEREFDYFTAVDDLGSAEETGAGMIGQVEFNSATFYRYAALDAHKLLANLQGDRDLALTGINAFTQAMARAIPSGKQNSFAAHNPPQFAGVVLRHASPFNLANAFERPVWPDRQRSLTAQSVLALATQERQLAAAYGDARDAWAALDLTGAWPQDLGEQPGSLDGLCAWLAQQLDARLPPAATTGA